MNVRIFTDGACSRNGKKGARASWAYWMPEHKHLSAADFIPENELQTNQRGELWPKQEVLLLFQTESLQDE